MDERIRKSRRQEKRGAERFGGRVNPGSGNQATHKGDVRTATELVEFKGTDKKSFSLKLSELLTATRHALLADRRMIFGIEFWETRDRYVVLQEDEYLADQQLKWAAANKIEELLEALSDANGRIADLEAQLAFALQSVGELLDLPEPLSPGRHCQSCDGHSCPDVG